MIPATKQTRQQVDIFLATRQTAKTIRTIWYQIKPEMKPWQKDKTEKAHSEYINDIIGAYLWEIFLEENSNIYNELGLVTKAIEYGEYPVVLFCEKDLGMFDYLDEELLQSVYLSSGQIPSYEVALLADSLKHHEEIYIVTANDVDPAGYNITSNLIGKLEDALYALGNTDPIVNHLPVVIDRPFQYETYTLALDQQKKWSYGGQGVELDAIPIDVLEDATTVALDAVPRSIFEPLATLRKHDELYYQALRDDKKYQKILQKTLKKQKKIRAKVEETPLIYSTDFNYSYKGVLLENIKEITPE